MLNTKKNFLQIIFSECLITKKSTIKNHLQELILLEKLNISKIQDLINFLVDLTSKICKDEQDTRQ